MQRLAARALALSLLTAPLVSAQDPPRAHEAPASGSRDATARGQRLAPVETWGELYGQPALRVGESTWVRLGVEARRAPPGSSLLVYALVEGPRLESGGDESLGPFELQREKAAERLLRARERRLELHRRALRVLYARSLRIGARGTLRWSLRREGRVFGSVAVLSTGTPVQPWFALRPAEAPAGSSSQTAASRDEVEREPGRAATPLEATTQAGVATWAGDVAVLAEYPGRLLPLHQRLPLSTPQKVRLGVRVLARGRRDRATLRLELPEGLANLRGKLLARWWINGRALIRPRVVEPERERSLERMEKLVLSRRVTLRLQPRSLGARPGDRISLQLLYCPHGWEPVELGGLNRARRGGLRRVRLSSGQPAISARVELPLAPN